MNFQAGVTGPCVLSRQLFSALTGFAARAAIVAACGATLVPNGAPAAESPRGVNLVFVLADDLGWADLECYGGKVVRNPG